ncbi:hypothetical protein OAO65_03900 [Flavobacteriales bacterium]|nr:hypothetical protein [Flavobacteriales bacterium]
MSARIAIVTTKQPGTNPRMRKNADALSAAGYDVKVLYAFNARWADETDADVLQKANWSAHRIGGHPEHSKLTFQKNRFMRKWGQWTGQLDLSFCPALNEYLSALNQFQPDLIIGHNPGALPILTKWKAATRKTVIFDAEDFHRGETEAGGGDALAVQRLEDQHLPKIDHITAASPLIGEAYQALYPTASVVTLNNAFELGLQPVFHDLSKGPLTLCWFSQVVGLDRGLEEFLNCIETWDDEPLTIRIIGSMSDSVRTQLLGILDETRHTFEEHPAASEQSLAAILAESHIGLALERTDVTNRKWCRTNKLYMYPLCGCYAVATRTPAQEHFFMDHPECGTLIDISEPSTITELLSHWSKNRAELEENRRRAWQLARNELNWDRESTILLNLVASTLQS